MLQGSQSDKDIVTRAVKDSEGTRPLIALRVCTVVRDARMAGGSDMYRHFHSKSHALQNHTCRLERLDEMHPTPITPRYARLIFCERHLASGPKGRDCSVSMLVEAGSLPHPNQRQKQRRTGLTIINVWHFLSYTCKSICPGGGFLSAALAAHFRGCNRWYAASGE